MSKKEILIVTTYPPRKCGIASFSDDLVKSLKGELNTSFQIRVCALESKLETGFTYGSIVKYRLNAERETDYLSLAQEINADDKIGLVLLNYEPDLYKECRQELLDFYYFLKKPIATLFHMIAPNPTYEQRMYMNILIAYSRSVVVMNNLSYKILDGYDIDKLKMNFIPHGTHPVKRVNQEILKEKYGLSKRTIFSTFGLIASHKNIEVAIEALPTLVKDDPSILYLVIGQTHPSTLSWQGEVYRNTLQKRVEELQLTDNVKFINEHIELPTLLEYLQLTDIYIFTTYVPNQTVSGTLLYALSCGCPVVATKILCTSDVLRNYPEAFFEHNDPNSLSALIKTILENEDLKDSMKTCGSQITEKTSWKQIAISYCRMFEDICSQQA